MNTHFTVIRRPPSRTNKRRADGEATGSLSVRQFVCILRSFEESDESAGQTVRFGLSGAARCQLSAPLRRERRTEGNAVRPSCRSSVEL
jgi:hypothetical protein